MAIHPDDLSSKAAAAGLQPTADPQARSPATAVRLDSLARWTRAVHAPGPQPQGPGRSSASASASSTRRAPAGEGAGAGHGSGANASASADASASSSAHARAAGEGGSGFDSSPGSAEAHRQAKPDALAREGTPGSAGANDARTDVPSNASASVASKAAANADHGADPAVRAYSLNALRGLHANHRDSALNAASTDPTGAKATRSDTESTATASALADLAAQRSLAGAFTAAPADAAGAAGGASASVHNEPLQSLIESCCSRLWVSEGTGAAQRGVMLDLGRWMPGCTIEVARAAGALRITLRGADEARRRVLEQELGGLAEGMAEKLGCGVVAAVETRQEPQP